MLSNGFLSTSHPLKVVNFPKKSSPGCQKNKLPCDPHIFIPLLLASSALLKIPSVARSLTRLSLSALTFPNSTK